MKKYTKIISLILAMVLVFSVVSLPAQAKTSKESLDLFGALAKGVNKMMEGIKEIILADEDAPGIVLKNMSSSSGKDKKSDELTLTKAQQPVIYEGRTYVPLRAVCEAIGYKVYWEQDAQIIRLKGNFLKKGKNAIRIENEEVELEPRYNQAYTVWRLFRDKYKNGVGTPSVNDKGVKYGFLSGVRCSADEDVADVLNASSCYVSITLRVGHNKAFTTLTDNGMFGLFKEIDGDYMSLEYTLDAVPVVIDGVTLIPLRAVAELMGMDVDWDGDNNNVIISAKKSGEYIKEETEFNKWWKEFKKNVK